MLIQGSNQILMKTYLEDVVLDPNTLEILASISANPLTSFPNGMILSPLTYSLPTSGQTFFLPVSLMANNQYDNSICWTYFSYEEYNFVYTLNQFQFIGLYIPNEGNYEVISLVLRGNNFDQISLNSAWLNFEANLYYFGFYYMNYQFYINYMIITDQSGHVYLNSTACDLAFLNSENIVCYLQDYASYTVYNWTGEVSSTGNTSCMPSSLVYLSHEKLACIILDSQSIVTMSPKNQSILWSNPIPLRAISNLFTSYTLSLNVLSWQNNSIQGYIFGYAQQGSSTVYSIDGNGLSINSSDSCLLPNGSISWPVISTGNMNQSLQVINITEWGDPNQVQSYDYGIDIGWITIISTILLIGSLYGRNKLLDMRERKALINKKLHEL